VRECDLVFRWPCFDRFQDRLAIAGWNRHNASHLRIAVLYRNCSTSYRRDIRLLPLAGSANRAAAVVVAQVRRGGPCCSDGSARDTAIIAGRLATAGGRCGPMSDLGVSVGGIRHALVRNRGSVHHDLLAGDKTGLV
jgi:hypothetical protein